MTGARSKAVCDPKQTNDRRCPHRTSFVRRSVRLDVEPRICEDGRSRPSSQNELLRSPERSEAVSNSQEFMRQTKKRFGPLSAERRNILGPYPRRGYGA